MIPVKKDHAAHRVKLGSRGGRPPVFDCERYKERNTVERCVNKLRQHRAVATRYDKRQLIYQGTGSATLSRNIPLHDRNREAPFPPHLSQSGHVRCHSDLHGTTEGRRSVAAGPRRMAERPHYPAAAPGGRTASTPGRWRLPHDRHAR
ncbi:transposase [Microbispora catharanthi]|uniref:Transposase n=1 Tax=Microbispora catharanthi TaxID=1712871 RepID=A0A5N6BG74_9ACTN|nr:transposase [Microbispora catharanthi]